MERLSSTEARAIMARCGVPAGVDYHALRYDVVDALLTEAKARGYRKSKNAPGSTARMFCQYVQRRARAAK